MNLHDRLSALVFLALTAAACQPDSAAAPADATKAPKKIELKTYGTLDGLMSGKLGPNVDLQTLGKDPSLIGLGSLSELRGEVWILGGDAWLGYPKADKTMWGQKLAAIKESAAFLVTASVPQWRTTPAGRDVPSAELEDFIAEKATAAGLDIKSGIPVVFTGPVAKLELSVAEGRGFTEGQKVDREKLLAEAAKAKFDTADAVIVGFFAENRPDIVHAGSRLHAHALVPGDDNNVAHIESVALTAATQVRLPPAE